MIKEKQELCKCIYCNEIPRIKHYDYDMWYVWCGCTKRNRYEYLGQTEEIAIDRWNYANRPINRTPPPKKEKKGNKDENGSAKRANA